MEIKIDNVYKIKSDDLQYKLYKRTGKPPPNTWKIIGYYSQLRNLLDDLIELKLRKTKLKKINEILNYMEEVKEEILAHISEGKLTDEQKQRTRKKKRKSNK